MADTCEEEAGDGVLLCVADRVEELSETGEMLIRSIAYCKTYLIPNNCY